MDDLDFLDLESEINCLDTSDTQTSAKALELQEPQFDPKIQNPEPHKPQVDISDAATTIQNVQEAHTNTDILAEPAKESQWEVIVKRLAVLNILPAIPVPCEFVSCWEGAIPVLAVIVQNVVVDDSSRCRMCTFGDMTGTVNACVDKSVPDIAPNMLLVARDVSICRPFCGYSVLVLSKENIIDLFQIQ